MLDLIFSEVFSNLIDSVIFHFGITGQHRPEQGTAHSLKHECMPEHILKAQICHFGADKSLRTQKKYSTQVLRAVRVSLALAPIRHNAGRERRGAERAPRARREGGSSARRPNGSSCGPSACPPDTSPAPTQPSPTLKSARVPCTLPPLRLAGVACQLTPCPPSAPADWPGGLRARESCGRGAGRMRR